MGVLGLWQLLAPVGQPVTLESLENKILAVDISIWLNQALKGYRDAQGGAINNAHLLSLFTRLCKLLFYKIRPIMVFDGGVPELKKQTVINRQQRRTALKQKSREAGLKLLANYMATHRSPKSKPKPNTFLASKNAVKDDLYKLPPLEKDSHYHPVDKIEDDFKYKALSCEELKYIERIDIDSKDFDVLPADIKQEILTTLKENRRRKNWEYYETLPKESNEFSSYQMQCLLKRRKIENKIEEVQRDMQKKHCLDIISLYADEPEMVGGTSKIMSDDCSHYILLKKANKEETADHNSLESRESEKIHNVKRKLLSEEIANDELDTSSDIKATCSSSELVDHVWNEPEQVEESTEQEVIEYLSDNSEIKNIPTRESSESDTEINSASIHHEQPIDDLNQHDDLDDLNCCNETNNYAIENDLILSQSGNTSTGSSVASINEDALNSLNIDVPKSQVMNKKSDSVQHQSQSSKSKPYLLYQQAADDKIVTNSSEAPNPVDKSAVVTGKCSSNNDLRIDVNYQVDDQMYDIPSTSSQNVSLHDELSGIELAIQKELQEASSSLRVQQAKQERQARTVQEHMVEECKELLRHFGVPYIVSPLEAEAQCAFFDLHGVTNGTITDDSDIWLFGGKRVYKNFFQQQKFVEFYKDSEVQSHFGLSRPKLINFALLTGSDYTEGIEDVGPVTAMEIISEFGGEGIDALVEFKRWWSEVNKHASPPKNKVRAKLQRLVLPESFPSQTIFDAYLNPEVDDSTESFSWGLPDLDSLRDYTKEKFGWNKTKVDDALLPVLKRLNERTAQTHLDNFFKVTLKKEKNLFPSKRIMSALKKLNPNTEESDCDDPKPKSAKTQAKSKVSKKKPPPSQRKRVTRPVQKSKAKPVLQLSEESSDSN